MLGSSSGETDKTKPCHEHLGLASALRVNVWPMCSASVQTASKVELPATTRRSPAQSAAGALEDHPEKWREKVQALQAPSSLPRALPGLRLCQEALGTPLVSRLEACLAPQVFNAETCPDAKVQGGAFHMLSKSSSSLMAGKKRTNFSSGAGFANARASDSRPELAAHNYRQIASRRAGTW